MKNTEYSDNGNAVMMITEKMDRPIENKQQQQQHLKIQSLLINNKTSIKQQQQQRQ